MNFSRNRRVWEFLGSLALIAVVSLPFWSFAKNHDGRTIYVNDNASGTEDGSSNHPYEHIYQATDKANDGDTIDVASGTYEENITIPTGVTLNGAGQDKVTIKADSKSKAVVTMKHKSKLWNVTVKNGQIGVLVKEDASVEIIGCRIINNSREGVAALKGPKCDKGLMSIVDSEIRDNGWSGVYSESRKVVILNSDIKNNGRNGVAFEAGTKGWIKNSSVSNNKENGLFVRLDNSNITLAKGNSIRNNQRDGVSIQANGAAGWVSIKNIKIVGNAHYAVARVAQGSVSAATWKGVTVESTEKFTGNGQGNVSPILR